MSTTLAIFRQRVSEPLGDWFSSTVTTALTTDDKVIDTGLTSIYGGDIDDFFVGWYILITSGTNSGELRRIEAYTASSGQFTVTGVNFSAETPDDTLKATYELHKINPLEKTRAINAAGRELWPGFHRIITDTSLVTRNILPDFNWWTSATAHKFYSASASATLARTDNSETFTRNERYCAKVTTSLADQYMYIDSDTWPELLDLKNTKVHLYSWVAPQTVDDAWVRIVTTQADGTTQTLTSSTTCPAGEETLLKLENQTLNDDLTFVSIRFGVTTSGQYAYFIAPRFIVPNNMEHYLLPELFQNAGLSTVRIQTTGLSVPLCDEIGLTKWADVYGWKPITRHIVSNPYQFLRVPTQYTKERRFELYGYAPLEDNLSADTDTMSIDDPQSEAVVAWAIMLLYGMRRGVIGASATEKYNTEFNFWRARAEELKNKYRMARPTSQISWSL